VTGRFDYFFMPAILIVIGSASATLGLILVIKPLLQRYSLARPNARSSHLEPTPQGAGMAVIAVSVMVYLLLPVAFSNFETRTLSPLIGAAVILSVVGAVDDIRTLQVLPRVSMQSLAVLISLLALPASFQIVPFAPIWLERMILFIALLWFINLTNFMDGIDWMTVAEFVPLTAALAAFGFMGYISTSAALIALSLCGAMIGFAPLNRPVARVFLGDVGSLPLGLLLGWILMLLAQKHLVAAILLPLYYIADASVTLIRRFLNGEPVLQAHRSHFYQRATSGGYSVRAIVSRVFLLNLALIVLASITLISSAIGVHLAMLAIGCVLVGYQLKKFQQGRPTL
jgi:UDP-N-acetylmuramyl pentapeptide phosphotransferase/UDP-N-acetylglucosamine-1-phosphate transferase